MDGRVLVGGVDGLGGVFSGRGHGGGWICAWQGKTKRIVMQP